MLYSKRHEFQLIANESDFLVINKSPGVNFHREGDIPGITEIVKNCLGIKTLLPVHRLDKVTSGILLMAKNRQAASQLAEQFRLRTVEKYYIAFSDRKPQKKQGLIGGDMKRGRRGSWMLTREQNNPAVTSFISRGSNSDYRVFILKPKTGRTHQLRVAMKSLGSPICGDPLYYPAPLKHEYCMLHSFALSFMMSEREYSFVSMPGWEECNIPSIREIVDSVSEPWSLFG